MAYAPHPRDDGPPPMGTVPVFHVTCSAPRPDLGWGSRRILLDFRPFFFFLNFEEHLYN